MLQPETTVVVLLVVQAAHLLHHRVARRHISFAEVASATILCIPLAALPAPLLMTLHLVAAGVQVVGSVWIDTLAPAWKSRGRFLARLG